MLFMCEGMIVIVYALTNHCQIYSTASSLIVEGIVTVLFACIFLITPDKC